MRVVGTVNVGALSGLSIEDFKEVCNVHGVRVVSALKLGGLLVKSYRVEIEGSPSAIKRVQRFMSSL
ncbi:hypothetical protein ABES03_08705 [Neobacillus rhizosphaerae]|uniref:hypothetical protein n=1 Tax=Neobacillus rhizosphaerae TaxID=2880965 RepID=UPI003D270BFE